jgi:hypothetical protein
MGALRFRRLVYARWEIDLPFPEQRRVQELVMRSAAVSW